MLRHSIVAVAVLLGLSFAIATTQSASAVPIQGRIGHGSGPGWAAAWIDLEQPMDFERGERLCFWIHGARFVLIRFLPNGENPNNPVGIDNGIRTVPENAPLEVTTTTSHRRIVQISVHGGAEAWNRPFPPGNGEPMLVSVDRLSAGEACR